MSESKNDLWSEAEWTTYKKQKGALGQLLDRAREDPMIPFFCGCTVFALLGGMKTSFISKNTKLASKFMLARVGSQAAAAGAIFWSIYKFSFDSPKGPAVKKAE